MELRVRLFRRNAFLVNKKRQQKTAAVFLTAAVFSFG
jgi:hypothetical protein